MRPMKLWNGTKLKLAIKSNNNPIKLFTVEVKDLVTTEGNYYYYLVYTVFYILKL
ncbi:17011_t:CDS:2 [Entrophospora sp. SA101]|nr:17011_t:CDS:2 [Entrophospora sp. SA101]